MKLEGAENARGEKKGGRKERRNGGERRHGEKVDKEHMQKPLTAPLNYKAPLMFLAFP